MAPEEVNEYIPDDSGGLPARLRYGPASKARFGFDEKIGKGDLACLILNGPAKDVEPEDIQIDDADEYRIVLSVGMLTKGGWDTPDGGKTIVNDRGKTRAPGIFGLGKFFAHMVKDKKDGGLGLAEELANCRSWREASTWLGAEFVLERVFEGEDEKTGKKYSHYIPVEVITYDKIGSIGGSSSRGSDDEEERPSSGKFKVTAFLKELDDDVVKALTKAANKSDSADDFSDRAADIAANIDGVGKSTLAIIVENAKTIWRELKD